MCLNQKDQYQKHLYLFITIQAIHISKRLYRPFWANYSFADLIYARAYYGRRMDFEWSTSATPVKLKISDKSLNQLSAHVAVASSNHIQLIWWLLPQVTNSKTCLGTINSTNATRRARQAMLGRVQRGVDDRVVEVERWEQSKRRDFSQSKPFFDQVAEVLYHFWWIPTALACDSVVAQSFEKFWAEDNRYCRFYFGLGQKARYFPSLLCNTLVDAWRLQSLPDLLAESCL